MPLEHSKMMISVVYLSISLLTAVLGKHILREIAKHHERPEYVRASRATSYHMHQITIGIQQRNLDVIEKNLNEVSDMASPKYGQHLSFEEVGNLVANPEATDAVTRWLRENRVNIVHTSTYGEYIVAQAPIRTLEKMFEAEFYEFSVADFVHEASRSSQTPLSVQGTVIRAPSYSVPDYLSHHIAGLMDITSLPTPLRPSAVVEKVTNDHGESLLTSAYATPITLTNYYNIYGDGYGKGNQTTYQSLNQAFLPSDISAFQTYFGLPKRAVDKIYGLQVPSGSSCLGSNGANNCAEASLDLQYILAVAKNVSTTYWYDVGNDYNFKNFIINVSSFAHPSLVFSISYGSYEASLSSAEISFWNTEAMKLGLRGVTIVVASGDDGVTGWLFRSYPTIYNITKCGYYASWPASSPYVTAVGGTLYGLDTGLAEVTNQVNNGGSITTGGGFSNSIAASSFQTTAINSYFSKVTPGQSIYAPYNKNNRGYPDISLNSQKYLVFIGGTLYSVSGTSASCPVFAGFVSLVNGMRLKSGGPSLGWINPTIYANNGGFVKNDITTGDNKCTASTKYCCAVGFTATTGWDPVTGFGSVDFTKFASYYMSISPTNYPTSSPTSSTSYPPSAYPSTSTTAAPVSDSTTSPSCFPSAEPSTIVSALPTARPTSLSSNSPTSSPTSSSTCTPTEVPSAQPSSKITGEPVSTPTFSPTALLTREPTADKTSSPSHVSSTNPTFELSVNPTAEPSAETSEVPTVTTTISSSFSPSSFPSFESTNNPISDATIQPSSYTTQNPSIGDTALPTSKPSSFPSASPSHTSSASPTKPTSCPSAAPSCKPSALPSPKPSVLPISSPTAKPSSIATASPSKRPTTSPSFKPSAPPTVKPTSFPTTSPSFKPSSSTTPKPTGFPTISPSVKPSNVPTSKPSPNPSAAITAKPSSLPTTKPSLRPSSIATQKPSRYPTAKPSAAPSSVKTVRPSPFPSARPTL